MANKIKKIADLYDVKHMVIHQLLKDAGKREVSKKHAKNTLAIKEKERNFVGRLHKSYNRKSSPIYGIFDKDYPKFKTSLETYSSKQIDFYEFSSELLNDYEKILKNTISATGGFMILIHYFNISSEKDLLMILMINNREGFNINTEKLELDEVRNIDLNKVDVACLKNLTDWENIKSGVEINRKTYLSFVRGIKDVSYYFMTFIGCENKTTSAEATERLLYALDEYTTNYLGLSGDHKLMRKQPVLDYCLKRTLAKREIDLDTISNIINPDESEHFKNFASAKEYEVSALISGDKNKLDKEHFFRYKKGDLKLEFSKERILNKEIALHNKGKDLIIKNISEDLRRKIETS